jgi:hypothetical protein
MITVCFFNRTVNSKLFSHTESQKQKKDHITVSTTSEEVPKRDSRSSAMLRKVCWCLFADVSGQPIGSILNGKAVKKNARQTIDHKQS